jgi:NAD(P)-dependent dehydrogenase (short-subunit alcohol dehydrogenase family)
MRLLNKCIVIGGAASGIGRATALLFGREGARLVLADIDQARGEATAADVRDSGGDAQFVLTDLSSADDTEKLLEEASRCLGGVDGILSIAGIQRAGHVDDFPLNEWEQVMAVNARSCFLAAKYGVPHLRSRGGGTITNMASLAALNGAAGMTVYSASKGAVVSFTRALAAELGPHRIRANAVCPGWVDTQFNEAAIAMLGGAERRDEMIQASVPLGRQGDANEIAEVLLFLTSDASSYMTGQALVVDGGLF